MTEVINRTLEDKIHHEELIKNKVPFYKKKRVLVGLVLFILGIISGISYYIHSTLYVSTDDAFIEGHVIQISPKVAGNIQRVLIDDNQQVKKGDLLVEIDPKDFVVKLEKAQAALQAAIARQKAANISVRLTDITSNAGVEQAYSGVDFSKSAAQITQEQIGVAQSGIEQAKSQMLEANANLEQVQSEISAAKAEAKLAENDLERFQKLHEQGAISTQQLDNAEARYSTAKARLTAANKKEDAAKSKIKSAFAAKTAADKTLNQAHARLTEAQAGIHQALGKLKEVDTTSHKVAISKSQLESANAEIKQLLAAVKQAELELSYTKIFAPESGQISRKAAENGAYVQTGQPLMAIVPKKTWVIANFKETQLTHMKPGQPVNVKVDTYPGKVFKGHVDSIQYGTGSRFSLLPPENAVGSYVKVVQRIPVKIVFDKKSDPDFVLVPGMSVVPEVRIK